ncbi:MAG TPA: outer membrane protein [Xanthobacteraceae bacterium]|jgi:outer membrane immunogenic protein|nr:outer membrane protein [Xanthobacteraceae bacterium]
MKRSLLAGASISALLLATGAQAADLGVRPARAPVYKAPAMAPWTWTGFYVGANVGAVAATRSVEDDPSTMGPLLSPLGAVDHNDKTGVIGGFEAGFNWQVSNVVLGAEADISFASLDSSSTVASFVGPFTYNSSLDWLSTVRGRLGLAFDRVLIYGTGGVAFAQLNEHLFDPAVSSFSVSPSPNVTGWTAGGGVEYAFTDHWTAKAEYLHVGFPDRTAASGGYIFKFKDALDIGRVGINYKF